MRTEVRYYNPSVERLSRQEVEGLQLRRLRALLERLERECPFYRRHFEAHGFKAEQVRSLQDFTSRAPFMGKQDLLQDQRERPPYGARLMASGTAIAFTLMTSGTTGIGQELHPITWPDLEQFADSWCYKLCWDGVRHGDRVYHMWPIAMQGAGVSFMRAIQTYGATSFLVPALDVQRKLETMRRFPPNYFVTVPAYLTRMTVVAQQMGIDPRRDFPDLRAVDATTQAYTLDWAREMEDFWGVRVVEMFGAHQGLPAVMATCEHGAQRDGGRGMMHALEHRLFFEVIDRETGRHVRPGEEGELVVTSLTREATPIVRFRMDDRVVYLPHTACDCGRPFAGIQSGTVARYDDMLKIKGTNVWPEAVDAAVFSLREVDDYNARVFIDAEGREIVEVKYELKPGAALSPEDRAALPDRLQAAVRNKVGVTMHFVEVPSGTVQRFEFKTRRWTDERRAGRQVEKYLAR